MKLKIEQKFQDKYNGTIYEAGDEIMVDKARGEELLADNRKLVSLIEEVVADEIVADKPKRKSAKK